MLEGKYVSLEISKRDEGYSMEMVPGPVGLSIHECKDFGDVVSRVLFYRDILDDKENCQIRFGRQSMKHFSPGEAHLLESLADMHNQLVEIKRTFDVRKGE